MNNVDEIDFRDPLTAFLADKTMSVPMGQALIFVILICLCMLFMRFRLGLLISYMFVYYWGFVFNRSYFVDILGDTTTGLYLYTFSGFIMLALAAVGLLKTAR
ncbi:MAG: hypothetical protein G3M78_04690 [Candidatus Nitrohelix vancouverensis]|uniref:Uncharacterized protein n=1 Tax=Candidatus Nitrohelix vancouverensis TaxID=2705534 RepID=A0A7T0C1E2_9BACT|nr:MAG: hypothetical protein G3M78_04690 [Candidatus Nitrohelix vancouverensis]